MTVLVITLGLSLLLGVTLRLRQGRVSRPAAHAAQAAELRTYGLDPGERGTVVEVTTKHCADCHSTWQALTSVASGEPGIAIYQLPAADHPQALSQWAILQAPTTLFFDSAGVLVARIGGKASQAGIESAMKGLAHVH